MRTSVTTVTGHASESTKFTTSSCGGTRIRYKVGALIAAALRVPETDVRRLWVPKIAPALVTALRPS
jgi:hypothetical protein